MWWQGMTVGILGALELQQVLAARLADCRPEPAATTAALAGLGTVGLGLSLCLPSVTSGVATVMSLAIHPVLSVVFANLISHLALKRGIWQGVSWLTHHCQYMCRGLGALLHAVLTKRPNAAHGMGDYWLRVVVQEFQPKLAKVQAFPWSVATADDEVHHIPLSQF